jgi:hypothetical protein
MLIDAALVFFVPSAESKLAVEGFRSKVCFNYRLEEFPRVELRTISLLPGPAGSERSDEE